MSDRKELDVKMNSFLGSVKDIYDEVKSSGVHTLSGERLSELSRDVINLASEAGANNYEYFEITGDSHSAYLDSKPYIMDVNRAIGNEVNERRSWMGDYDGKVFDERKAESDRLSYIFDEVVEKIARSGKSSPYGISLESEFFIDLLSCGAKLKSISYLSSPSCEEIGCMGTYKGHKIITRWEGNVPISEIKLREENE